MTYLELCAENRALFEALEHNTYQRREWSLMGYDRIKLDKIRELISKKLGLNMDLLEMFLHTKTMVDNEVTEQQLFQAQQARYQNGRISEGDFGLKKPLDS